MMSDPTTVDQVTVDEVTGKLVLLIEEDRPWTEADLMHRQLVAKIKLYVRTIRSPAFVQQHKRQPKDTIVRLVSDHRPGEETRQLLKRVGYELQKHGIDFEQEVATGDSTYPPARSVPSTGTTAPPTTAPPTAAPPQPRPPPPPPRPAAPPPSPPEPVAPPPQRDTPEPQELEPIASADVPEEDDGGLPFVEPETPPPKAAAGAGTPSGSTGLDDEAVFPEEEFGRADWELQDEPLVFESGSGKKMILSRPGDAGSTAPPMTYEEAAALERPGIFRALWAAFTAALTGAVFWPLVAAAVGQTVGPVAIAIGFMVGFAVRLKASPALVYRIIAVIGTLFGFAIGASLTAATLNALTERSGFGGIIAILSNTSAIYSTVLTTFRWYDLVFFGIGLYLAIRLAAPKAEA